MSKHLWAKYYQESKEILQKKLMKDIRTFLKKKKNKKKYGCERLEKSLQKWKAKACWVEKKYYSMRKYALSYL